MAQVITTNTLSQLTQNNLSKSQNQLNTAIERLSSGQRINGAKDDAAGLGIANRLSAQVTGLTQANRNANDGLAMAQTADSALGSVTDSLQRIRELTVQAKNGTNNGTDVTSINGEITQRMAEINRTAQQTNFNNRQLLGASGTGTGATALSTSINIQVGANDGQTITITLGDVTTGSLFSGTGAGTPGTGTNGFSATSPTALATIDRALQRVDGLRSGLGAVQNRMQSAIETNASTSTNLAAARSNIADADYATEVSNMTTANILQQAGNSVLAQANQRPQSVLSLLQ